MNAGQPCLRFAIKLMQLRKDFQMDVPYGMPHDFIKMPQMDGMELLRRVRQQVGVPLIASGGAGAVEHFPPAVAAGANAVLAASVFHFGELTIGAVKDALRGAGAPIR